jgi:hypothetical protein
MVHTLPFLNSVFKEIHHAQMVPTNDENDHQERISRIKPIRVIRCHSWYSFLFSIYPILTGTYLYISVLLNPVRNSSPAIAGLETERGTRRARAGAAGYF